MGGLSLPIVILFIPAFFFVCLVSYLLFVLYKFPWKMTEWEAFGSDFPYCLHLNIALCIKATKYKVFGGRVDYSQLCENVQQTVSFEEESQVLCVPNTYNRLRISSFLIPLTWLLEYRKLCKIEADTFEYIPPVFPYYLCFPQTLVLFTRQQFGLDPNSIEIKNMKLTAHEDLNLLLHDELILEAHVTQYREVAAGIEVDILYEVLDTRDIVLWSCVTTFISSSGTDALSFTRNTEVIGTASDDDSHDGDYDHQDGDEVIGDDSSKRVLDARVMAEADIGRKYGVSCGDVRPSHMFPWSARLVGLSKPIVHVTWLLASALEQLRLKDKLPSAPFSVDCRVKNHLSLPSEFRVRAFQSCDNGLSVDVSSIRCDLPFLDMSVYKL